MICGAVTLKRVLTDFVNGREGGVNQMKANCKLRVIYKYILRGMCRR